MSVMPPMPGETVGARRRTRPAKAYQGSTPGSSPICRVPEGMMGSRVGEDGVTKVYQGGSFVSCNPRKQPSLTTGRVVLDPTLVAGGRVVGQQAQQGGGMNFGTLLLGGLVGYLAAGMFKKGR